MSEKMYRAAQKRVKEKKDFYSHLSTYLVMAIFFFVLNALTSFGQWWFYWPLLGWGVGLVMHYFKVFGFPGVGPMDAKWEQQEMERELRKLDRGQKRMEEEDDYLELPELEKEKQRSWKDEDLV